MTDLQPLLTAIITNPDDDVPRLMYADELMESDSSLDRALGEYIKLGIDITIGNFKNNPNYLELFQHCGRLRKKMAGMWPIVSQHPIYQPYDVLGLHYNSIFDIVGVERGFIRSITCTASQFLSICDKLIWHESMVDKLDAFDMRKKRDTEWYVEKPRPCPLTAHPVRGIEITDSRRVIDSKLFEWEKLAEKYDIEFNISDLP